MTATSIDRPVVLRKLSAYVALTKPRIIELLLVTTVPAMVVAADGDPGWRLVLATVLGGTLSAGGANATNMVIDRDIDRVMERTKGRPLVTGEAQPGPALVYAVLLQVAGFALLWSEANLLAACLSAGAGLFYVFVYSLWLKRTHEQNIVIGGAAGSVPPMVGWAAVTGELGPEPLVLFLFVFLWTPPHFWALAMRYADDYRSVDVPMLPSVATTERTTNQILVYAVLVWITGIAFGPVAGLGAVYLVAAVVGGGAFVWHAAKLRQDPGPRQAMRTFGYSITMVVIVFGAMIADVAVRAAW